MLPESWSVATKVTTTVPISISSYTEAASDWVENTGGLSSTSVMKTVMVVMLVSAGCPPSRTATVSITVLVVSWSSS